MLLIILTMELHLFHSLARWREGGTTDISSHKLFLLIGNSYAQRLEL